MKNHSNLRVGSLAGHPPAWTPAASDVAWTQRTVGGIKDGGVWGLPSARMAYRINHTERKLELVEGAATDLHERVTKCCALMTPPYVVVIAPERRQNLATN